MFIDSFLLPDTTLRVFVFISSLSDHFSLRLRRCCYLPFTDEETEMIVKMSSHLACRPSLFHLYMAAWLLFYTCT